MKTDTKNIFIAALSLPAENRASLAEKLLESLEQKDLAEIEQAWVEEAEERLRAYERGEIKSIPGDKVMKSLSARKRQ